MRAIDFKQLYDYPPVDVVDFTEKVLGLKGQIWSRLLDKLVEAWHGGDYWLVVLDGATGWGKTTFVKISLAYLFYNAIALKNPQRAFGFARGSQLSILGIGKTKEQSKNIIMNDLRVMFKNSPFFEKLRKLRRLYTTRTEIREPHKGVYLLVAGSLHDENILGLNLLGAVMEEANFWGVLLKSKKGTNYNIATEVFEQLLRRFYSRHSDIVRRAEELPFIPKLIVASSNYYRHDLTEQLREEWEGREGVYFAKMATWDTKPVSMFSPKAFKVCIGNHLQIPRIIDSIKDCSGCLIHPNKTYKTCKHQIVEVPEDFRYAFERDIIGAMRDFVGIAYNAIEPFIRYPEKLYACIDDSITAIFTKELQLVKKGGRYELYLPDIELPLRIDKPRYAHVDLGLKYDATGFAMGYVDRVEKFERIDANGFKTTEYLPVIVVDFMVKIEPPEDGEIPIEEVRKLIYWLSSKGIRFKQITFDMFQSVDSMQILQSKGYNTDYFSVDRDTDAYYTFRNALYDGRLKLVRYQPFIDEVLSLEDDLERGKVDHPPDGSKDVADAVASVVYHCTINAPSTMPAQIITDSPKKEKEWWTDLMF
jgi:hypothetical protein